MDAKLMLKIVFACIACDGEIAKEEITLLSDITDREELLKGFDVRTEITKLVSELNASPKEFFSSLFNELERNQFSTEDELQIVKISIDTIESDNNIDYKEIKFFKAIRSYLKLTDEMILEKFPDKEDYLAQDIKQSDYLHDFLGLTENCTIQLKNFV